MLRIAVSLAALMLMLGSAAAQQSHEPGWIADAKGCRARDAYPEPGESVAWSGTCVNGYAEGDGVMQWYRNGKPSDRYEGGYKMGRMSGHGVFAYSSGSRYEGDWMDDKHDGHGVFVWSTGDRYDGDWKSGERDGHGVEAFKNGDRYEGGWKDGKMEGKGVLVHADGDRYEGDFHKNHAEGEGTLTMADGGRYKGDFKDDLPNGDGSYRDAKGHGFVGKWTNGCFYENKPRYVQDFAKEEMVGAGARRAAVGVEDWQCK